MKSKKEVLEVIVKNKICKGINCDYCPYNYYNDDDDFYYCKFVKIGAMAISRMFRKKKKPILEVGSKIRFDNGKLYNIEKRVDLYNREEYCLRDKNTMVCYPMDYLIGKIWEIVE